MSGSVTFQVVGRDSGELTLEFLRAFHDQRDAEFEAIRLDDPRLQPEVHNFTVRIETIHNGSPRAFDVIDANHHWFRITIDEIEPVRFDLII